MNTRKRKMTLEDLLIQKQKISENIEIQRNKIIRSYSSLTEPFVFKSIHSSIMKKITTGFAIFDGFMIGLKIIRKIRKIFR